MDSVVSAMDGGWFRGGARVLALLLALALSGCSWILVDRKPSSWTPERYPQCTTNNVAPALDLIPLAFLLGLTVILNAEAERDCREMECVEPFMPLVVGGVPALVFTASAITGFKWTATCREARKAWRAHHASPRAGDESAR